jgi:hypothetical protein
MDRFFDEENVRRYRKLRDFGTDEAQRAPILKQLAGEFEQFRCEVAKSRDVGNAGRELRREPQFG